jgi:hypothetical protein
MGSAGWLTLYIEAKVYAAQKAEISRGHRLRDNARDVQRNSVKAEWSFRA